MPILDGDIRPQSKRDAFKRRFYSTMGKINSFFCRQSAMKLSGQSSTNMTQNDKEDLDEYNKQAKLLEKHNRLHIPSSFMVDLKHALDETQAFVPDRQSGGYVSERILKAEYESDYLIAYRICSGQSTLVYSTDVDMNALCGPMCLTVRSVKKEKQANTPLDFSSNKRAASNGERTMYTYEISGSSNTIMNEIKEMIAQNSPSSKIVYTEAKYPILEEVVPPMLTALMVIGIGCDILPRGVTGISPLVVQKELSFLREQEQQQDVVVSPHEHYTNQYNKLIDLYLKKDKSKKLTKEYLRTYCQAFLYQPGLEMGLRNDPSAWKYVFERPSTLHPYLKMFRHVDSDTLVEDESVSTVKTLF